MITADATTNEQVEFRKTDRKTGSRHKDSSNMQPDFKRVHRVRKTVNGKCRDIVARLARLPERDAALQERRKLAKNNSRIFLNQCKNTLEVRKNQSEKQKESKAGGRGYFN